jgi:methylated-DNA-[protein]-cysteine S-methyltransferase
VQSNGRDELTALVFLPPDVALLQANSAHRALVESVQDALARWLDNPDATFDLPLAPQGTAFQQKVWRAISDIPRGDIRTYGALSAIAGGTARAVGQACGANPFPIVVPCHRVVAKTGLGGFANANEGWLLDTKRWLLRHEGVL